MKYFTDSVFRDMASFVREHKIRQETLDSAQSRVILTELLEGYINAIEDTNAQKAITVIYMLWLDGSEHE